MRAIEYRTMDAAKAAWGEGEWTNEPDKKQWEDPKTGLPCLIVRNHWGALCGYVGVPTDHPFHGRDYDDVNEAGVEVHGGLTFSQECQEGDESTSICHVAGDGDGSGGDEVAWWLGFDCCHVFDIAPGLLQIPGGVATYKNFEWVTREVESLARQLKAIQVQGGGCGRPTLA